MRHNKVESWFLKGGTTLAQKALLAREVAQVRLGARAEMADHLRGRETAEAGAAREVEVFGEPGQEPGRKEIAGPGGVHHPLHRKGRHRPRLAARDDERPALGPGHDAEHGFLAQGPESGA